MKKTEKKKLVFIILIAVVLITAACFVWKAVIHKEPDDAARFAEEYPGVSADNVFVYKTADEVLELMRSGTGVVYLGYPECGWCQAYVSYLDETAREKGIREIWYCNTKEVKEQDMDKYYELIAMLDGCLQYTDSGEQWIYVPDVSFHINGELVGNDYETSKDTHNLTEPAEYWTEAEVRELKQTLGGYMEQVLAAMECSKADEPLQVAFYYENVCASCEGDADFFALYNKCLSPEEKEGLNVEIATYNVFMDSCRERYEKESERLEIPGETSLPVLVIGEKWYSGYEEMEKAIRLLPTQNMKKM